MHAFISLPAATKTKVAVTFRPSKVACLFNLKEMSRFLAGPGPHHDGQLEKKFQLPFRVTENPIHHRRNPHHPRNQCLQKDAYLSTIERV